MTRLGRTVRAALPGPRSTPLTFGYLAVLAASTVVLRTVDAHTAHGILVASSTDVHHLRRDPLRVLVASALWLPGRRWLPEAVLFALLLAPVERRLGSRWLLAVFASGHVLATLGTELPVAWVVATHRLPDSSAHRIDVGVSYGLYTTTAVAAGLLRGRMCWLLLAGAGATIVVAGALDPDLTTAGHALSLAIGLAWWPWLRRRGVWRRLPVRVALGGAG